MVMISRTERTRILIGDNITITVERIYPERVKLRARDQASKTRAVRWLALNEQMDIGNSLKLELADNEQLTIQVAGIQEGRARFGLNVPDRIRIQREDTLRRGR